MGEISLDRLDAILESIAKAIDLGQMQRVDLYKSISSKINIAINAIATAIAFKLPQDDGFKLVTQTGLKEASASTRKLVANGLREAFAAGCSKTFSSEKNGDAYVSYAESENYQLAFVLVAQGGKDKFVRQVHVDLAEEVANQICKYENLHAARKTNRSAQELAKLSQFLIGIGKANNRKELAFQMVNDLARLSNATSVIFLNRVARIVAASGVPSTSNKTNYARGIRCVAQLAKKNKGQIEWKDGEFSVVGKGRFRHAKKAANLLPTRSGFTIPVVQDKPFFGVLVFLFSDDSAPSPFESQEIASQVLKNCQDPIRRAVRIHSIPFIRQLDSICNGFLFRPFRLLTSVLLTFFLIGLSIFLLFFSEREFEIPAHGVLKTEREHNVFCPVDGKLVSLNVKEYQTVKPSEVLAKLDSVELRKQLVELEGELGEVSQRIRAFELAGNRLVNDESENFQLVASELQKLRIRNSNLLKQKNFLETTKKELLVRSPGTGQITTPNLIENLADRPLRRGDFLMKLADTDGPWCLEVFVPDRLIEYVSTNASSSDASLRCRLVSNSELEFKGTIREIDFRSTNNSYGEPGFTKIIVEIDKSELGPDCRLGTRVHTRISCGKRNNFFLFTYELRGKLRELLFF